jgi:hypothetical protein
MARLGRLERPTSCFGGTRSIQLSYSRTPSFISCGPLARILELLFDGAAAEVLSSKMEWITRRPNNYLVLSF